MTILPLEDNVTWVLTVPAIWDEPAKQFMEEAAEKVNKMCLYSFTYIVGIKSARKNSYSQD